MATYTGLILWLKDKNASIPEKLKLSKFAWGTDAVHIPNKEQQLLDFICGLLVNKKKHTLQGTDVLSTWKTLLLFLQAVGHTALVKPSILQAAVEDLGKITKEDTSETDAQLDLSNTVISCVCNLLALPSVASAQVELLCSLLVSACCLKSHGEINLSESADKLFLSVLPVLMKCQRAHLNQLQVLHAVLDKVLTWSLRVIDKCPSNIAKMLENFLLATLLHSDHKEAYEVYLRHSCGEPSPGQPKQPPKVMTSLFTTLASLIAEEDTKDAAMKFIPLLLQSFLKEQRQDPRVCFLMLKRLVKLMTPMVYSDSKSVDAENTEDSNTDSGWLVGVSACIEVCQNEAGLDLFSASRQSGNVLTWFSKLTQLVASQERTPPWFDFMRHTLGLNHLVVEKSWHGMLRHSLTSPQQKPGGLEDAQDKFLCEIVNVYVRMRRASDLLSALIEACLTSSGNVTCIQKSESFYKSLCVMFREVPLTTLLEMWEKLQSKASLLVQHATSQISSENTNLQSQLAWILGLYTALLGHGRLFDHRSVGAFSSRITALVDSIGELLLTPLYKTKEMRKLCPEAGDLLKTWSTLQVMLLPRWRESDRDQETPRDFAQLRKWIKRLEAPDKAKISLQRSEVASPDSCPMVLEEGSGEGTLEQVVEGLLEALHGQLQYVMGAAENQVTSNTLRTSAMAQYSSLCELLPLIGTRLSHQLLSRCADLTLSILGHGQGQSWTDSCLSILHGKDASQQQRFNLLSTARNLILHPATKELRHFQQRIATQAWAEIIGNMTLRSLSPSKKRRKTEREGKSVSQKIACLLTDNELKLQDIGEISVKELDAEISNPLTCKEMLKVLSCLDLEYLPDLNLRCQVGAVTLLACWARSGHSKNDHLKADGERLFVRAMSVPNTSRLFKIIQAKELLMLVTDYCAKNHGISIQLLEVAVQAVMMEHGSVLHMPDFVKQVLSNLDSDLTHSGCVKFQLLSLLVKQCHKYLKKAFHVKQVGQAATDVFFSVARYIIRHGLGWYKNLEQQTQTHTSAATPDKGSSIPPQQKESQKAKRKRAKSENRGEGGDHVGMQDTMRHGAETSVIDLAWNVGMQDTMRHGAETTSVIDLAWNALLSCVSAVLDLWDVQVAEVKVNQHLELMVTQIVDMVLSRWTDMVKRAELVFVQSCCYCRLRSSKVSVCEEAVNKETEHKPEHSGGLGLISVESYPKLWSACFREAQRAVRNSMENVESLETVSPGVDTSVELNRSEGSQVSYQDNRGFCLTTDALCALLASSDPGTFDILMDSLQAHLGLSSDLDPASVVVTTDVWRKLLASEDLREQPSQILFKNMYQLLSSLLGIVQNFAVCDSPQDSHRLTQNSALLIQAREKKVASRCIVRALTDFAELGKSYVTPRMTLLCLHAGFCLDLAHPADVEVLCGLLNALLVRHTNTVHTTVPAVLELVNKLLRACMSLGGQDRLPPDSEIFPQVLHSAQLVTRLMTLLSSPAYKTELQKVAHTVVAEYVTGIQRQSLHAAVKAELLRGLYKLMSVSDKFRLAALNAALPPGVKDTFKVLHQDYNKYHRYAGAV